MCLLSDHKGVSKAKLREDGMYLYEGQSMNLYRLTRYTCNVVEFDGGNKSGIAQWMPRIE